MISALTFDAAGTLIVPHPGVGAVYAEVAAGFGLERDAADLERRFPSAFAGVRARWAVPYGADEDDARRFWDEVVQATFDEPLPYEIACDLFDTFATARRWRVLPGVREALALAAARGMPMAVVSNFDGRLTPLLDELGLGPFVCIVTSAMVGRAKPDPAPLMAACARLGVEPARLAHVGDSEREDAAMCAAVGARFVRCDAERGVPVAAIAALLAEVA